MARRDRTARKRVIDFRNLKEPVMDVPGTWRTGTAYLVLSDSGDVYGLFPSLQAIGDFYKQEAAGVLGEVERDFTDPKEREKELRRMGYEGRFEDRQGILDYLMQIKDTIHDKVYRISVREVIYPR